jgi:hypothetical protein
VGAKLEGESKPIPSAGGSRDAELRDFKNVTHHVMQDALQVWAQLWGELESQVSSEDDQGGKIPKEFTPSYGWSEFLNKMWLLRHYLVFTKCLSQREQEIE